MSFSINKLIEPGNRAFTQESFAQKMKEVQGHLTDFSDGVGMPREYRSMSEHAIAYANAGYLVIPLHYPTPKGCSCKKTSCSSIGKHPITKNGLNDASNNIQLISDWWWQYPMANIGLITGRESSIVVLDVDKDAQGFRSLEELITEFGELPTSRRVQSGGGGLHIYFATAEQSLKNRAGLLPGLDIRGDGGYIVAPPSMHCSGKKYLWITKQEDQLDVMPGWLFELASSQQKRSNFESLCGLIGPGRRNQTLASIGGLLRRHGLEESAITSGLIALNGTICEPKLAEEEVIKIAQSMAGYQQAEVWPAAMPLPARKVEAQEMSEDFIPVAIRAWVVDNAERMQVPIEFLATPAIVAAASLIGRKLAIKPDAKDSWTVVPNLWGFIVAEPGSLKSPAISEAMRPLEILAKKARQSFLDQCRREQIEELKIKTELDSIRETLKGSRKEGFLEAAANQQKQLFRLQEQQAEKQKVVEKRYKTSDPTPEKLAVLLQENPQGILLLRDELSGWLESFRQKGREGSREFYLESWNGNSSFSVDRIGRGTMHVDALCLSIFGGIQPTKLAAYIEKTTSANGDDGFLERFQLAVYPERKKNWQLISRQPDVLASEQAFKAFERLDQLDTNLICGAHESKIPFLRFSLEAQPLVDNWRVQLEQRILNRDLPPIFRAHLSKYRSLVPSLALVFALMKLDAQNALSVGPEEAELAIKWSVYLESHAKKIYQNLLHSEDTGARTLSEKIKSHCVSDREKIRDIQRHSWRGLSTPEKLKSSILTLSQLNWVRVESVNTSGGPSEILRINPQLPEGDV